MARGELPWWAARLGYGYGYGDGSGSGYGAGDGGYGDGSGYGDGDGYGYGDGDGYGDGSGSGEDVHRCSPREVVVTSEQLAAFDPCEDGLSAFTRIFPNGAVWPRDLASAQAAGLPVGWAAEKLGLPWPTWNE